MSGATGDLNEIFVYGRSPLREVGGGNDHKFRLELRSRSKESFSTVCETRPGTNIRRATVDRQVKAPEAPNGFSSLIGGAWVRRTI
jgi:hypothetical protein